jgi:hypothetical protein
MYRIDTIGALCMYVCMHYDYMIIVRTQVRSRKAHTMARDRDTSSKDRITAAEKHRDLGRYS